MKTLLKSVHIYQSYCKKNLAQFFLAHPVYHQFSATLQRHALRFKQQTDPRIFGRTRISDQIFLRGGQDLTKSYWIRCIGQGAARTVLGGRLRSLIASVIITFPSRLSWTMSRSELAMPMKAQIWDSNSVAPSLNICSRFFVQPEPYK